MASNSTAEVQVEAYKRTLVFVSKSRKQRTISGVASRNWLVVLSAIYTGMGGPATHLGVVFVYEAFLGHAPTLNYANKG